MAEPSKKDVRLGFAALGGMSEFYQLANSKMEYSKALAEEHVPTDEERLYWLKEMINFLSILNSHQAFQGPLISALQTRKVVSGLLDEMGTLLEKVLGRKPGDRLQ